MICFPNAKINLGLQVARRREDGFHNLRSVFYPVPLYDVLEFQKAEAFSITVWGLGKSVQLKHNLVAKTWKILSARFGVPPVEVHLLKNIPLGAGLGGGSADAVFFIREMLSYFQIEISDKELLDVASELCSDCPFFLHNKAAYVIGRGNVVEPLEFDLSGYYLVLFFPDEPVSTADAFSRIIPKSPEYNLKKLVLEKDFNAWREQLVNDFESILPSQLLAVKTELYNAGALYASLTGSGSAFYGIFEHKPDKINFQRYKTVVL